MGYKLCRNQLKGTLNVLIFSPYKLLLYRPQRVERSRNQLAAGKLLQLSTSIQPDMQLCFFWLWRLIFIIQPGRTQLLCLIHPVAF